MGYGIYFKTKEGYPLDVEDISHTYNCSEMFCLAIPGGINGLDGTKCSAAIPILSEGVHYFIGNKDHLLAIEPPNKWGSYETALEFLLKIKRVCESYPEAFIRVC